MGGVTVLGDIEMVSQLAAQTGFTAATATQQFSPNAIDEFNRNGYVGAYAGTSVVRLSNPIIDGDELALTTKELYILPSGIDVGMRPLKVVYEGDVYSIENTNIDDMSFEVRLDQYFNAAVVYGDRPYMGIYRVQFHVSTFPPFSRQRDYMQYLTTRTALELLRTYWTKSSLVQGGRAG